MAHLHDVIDDDLHFKIDPETRKITRTSENPIVIVQNDHNSERLTFEIPSEIDGHEMKLCDKVRIHFLNVDAANTTNNTPGIYESDDLDFLEDDDGTLVFSWLIHQDSTGYAGPLNFAISFECTSEKTEEDGSKSTIVEYSWNTLPDTEDVSVSGGMNNSDALTGDDYYSVLDSWLNQINNQGVTAQNELTAHVDKTKIAVEASVNAYGTQVKKSINDFAGEVKEQLGKQTLMDLGVVVQDTGTATDKVMSQDATTKAVEAAKVHANSKASETESRINQKHTQLVDAVTNQALYKAKDQNNITEYGKAYRIVNKKSSSVSGWGFGLYSCFYVYGTTSNGRVEKFSEIAKIPAEEFIPFHRELINDDKISENSKPTHEDISSYNENEFVIRMLGYELEWVDTGMGVNLYARIRYDLNDGDERKLEKSPITHRIDVSDFIPSQNWGVVFDECGFMIIPDDGVTDSDITVYEINDDPASVSVFKVNANGISDISKTGTSGLTDTYTITLDDGTTKNFYVRNGLGISSVSAFNEDDYGTTHVISFNDGHFYQFRTPNTNSVGIKTPVSGSVIHAEDVIPLGHRVHVEARSKNLIIQPYLTDTSTYNGITYTVNDDHSITVVGTVPDGVFSSFKLADISAALNHGQTYYIGGSANMLLAYKDESGTIRYAKNGKFTWSAGYEFMQLYLQYSSNNGTVNETIYPFICKAGEATEYTPYVDITTIKLTRCGKNMFNPAKLLAATGWTVTNGVYSGTPGALHNKYGPETGTPICGSFEPNTQYTLSMEAMGELTDAAPKSLHIRFVYSDGNYKTLNIDTSVLTKYTFTSDAGKTVTGIYMSYTHNVKTHLRNIQLEKGPVATDYQPYSGTEYEVYSNGEPKTPVMSVSPTMTLFADKPGVIIHATYNVDQTAAFNKCEARVDAKIAELQAMIDSLKAT